MKFLLCQKTFVPANRCICIGFGAGLLWVRDGMNCHGDETPENMVFRPIVLANNSLNNAERNYGSNRDNMETEKFHHYCCIREVRIITGCRPLVVSSKKDMATQPQWLQHRLVRIHQFRLCIVYKPGHYLNIADCLSRQNHTENKDDRN